MTKLGARQSRRTLIKGAISALLPASVFSFETAAAFDSTTTPASSVGNSENDSLFISGARRAGDDYLAVVFNAQGELLAEVPLTARAHGAASHRSSHRACLFARRPGMYLNTFDLRAPSIHTVNVPVSGRHFYGHGVYSEDGYTLFATENDYESARGVLGIYDATQGYLRAGEFDTGGIGPHEVVCVPGTSLLVVANGGIQTHPDSGRDKLNIDTMEPSITIIDTRNGRIVARHRLPDELHQVSIRHLACSDDGVIWFAGQYEGSDLEISGLAGSMSIEQSLRSFAAGHSSRGLILIDLPPSLQSQVSHYLSSVTVIGAHVVFTAAKGGVTFTVNRLTQVIDERFLILDCSGVAGTSAVTSDVTANVVVTSGTGGIYSIVDNRLGRIARHNLQWDNHVYRA